MSNAPFTVSRLYATPAQIALAPRYSTLQGAWDNITPGTVVRDSTGTVVAGHADQFDWLTPETVGLTPGTALVHRDLSSQSGLAAVAHA